MKKYIFYILYKMETLIHTEDEVEKEEEEEEEEEIYDQQYKDCVP